MQVLIDNLWDIVGAVVVLVVVVVVAITVLRE